MDIQSQLESRKIVWLRRLLADNFHALKSILDALFSDIGINTATNRLLGERK